MNRVVVKMKRQLYLPLVLTLLVSLISGALPLGQTANVYAAPDTESLWSGSNSVTTGLTLTSSANADGSTIDTWADADGLWAKKNYSWTFVMDDSTGTGIINSVTLYLKHYQSGWADDSYNIEISSDGTNWTPVQSYTDGGTAPPTADTTDSWDASAALDTWTKIDAAQVRIYGLASVPGEDAVVWFVDTVELRVDYTPPPTVTGITPGKGTTADTALSITNLAGTGFIAGASVELNFNGADSIAATGVNVVGATQITCSFDLSGVTTNLGAAWDVKVTNTDTQSGTGNDLFTIYRPDPTVTSITPSSGENTGSVSITDLAGTNFVDGSTAVKLAKGGESDIDGTSVTVVSAIKITCDFDITGAAVGAWDVVVTVTGAESSATLAAGFDVTTSAPPDISNTPDSWALGTVDADSSHETGITYSVGVSGFQITNNSAFGVNITIKAENMGTGWLLADTGDPDATHYTLWAGTELTGGLYNIQVTSAGVPLITVLASSTGDWGLKLFTPTSFSDGGPKSGTVTLTATQA